MNLLFEAKIHKNPQIEPFEQKKTGTQQRFASLTVHYTLLTTHYFTGWSSANAFNLSAKTGICSLCIKEVQARTPCLVLPQVSMAMPEMP